MQSINGNDLFDMNMVFQQSNSQVLPNPNGFSTARAVDAKDWNGSPSRPKKQRKRHRQASGEHDNEAGGEEGNGDMEEDFLVLPRFGNPADFRMSVS